MMILRCRGRNWGGRWWRRTPPLEFHTWTMEMSLIRGATHFALGLRSCIISSFLLQIYLRPPLEIPQLRPC